jgi:hypothetical protein
VTAFQGVDFFSDPSVNADPYPYYEYLRTQGPVCPILDRLAISGSMRPTTVRRKTADSTTSQFGS